MFLAERGEDAGWLIIATLVVLRYPFEREFFHLVHTVGCRMIGVITLIDGSGAHVGVSEGHHLALDRDAITYLAGCWNPAKKTA